LLAVIGVRKTFPHGLGLVLSFGFIAYGMDLNAVWL